MKNHFEVKELVDRFSLGDFSWTYSSLNNTITYAPCLEDMFLCFKINETHLSLKSGFQVIEAEKKLKWFYRNYKDLDFLVVGVEKFVWKYRGSFHLTRKIKK